MNYKLDKSKNTMTGKKGRILFGLLFTLLGALLLLSNLSFGQIPISNANEDADVPVITGVTNRAGSPEMSPHFTADQFPVVTGFAFATNSKIILYQDGNEVENTNIISVLDPRYTLPYWEYEWQTPLETGQFYELEVSEVIDFGNGNPAGSSEIFLMGILDVTSQTFLPLSNVPPVAPDPTPTPTPSVAIVNGDFESGESGWTFNDAALGASTVNNANSINGRSGLIGDPSYNNSNGVPVGYGEIKQTIFVPDSGGVLVFKYHVYTHDRVYSVEGQELFDTFELYINTTPSDTQRVHRLCDRNRYRH